MRDKRETSREDLKPLTPPRQPEPGEVLRAPVTGPIDWAALSRECRSRYPKILAALAEYERRCRARRERE